MKATDQLLLPDILSSQNITFFIPPYQRNYEWSESQCKAFFDDVLQLTAKNSDGKEEEHFFGSIVYFYDSQTAIGEPRKAILIDGQQRITTTMLFLIAIRNTLKDKNKADGIDELYLMNRRSSENLKIKLKQVEADWPSYMSIILNDNNGMNKDSAVYRNYSYFLQRISSLEDHSDAFLEKMVNCGLAFFRVVQIVLDYPQNKWENPQEIFESLNSLGKPLSLSDLIRNYLLMGKSSREQTSLYNNYWLKIEKNMNGRISSFIRDYMQMKACKYVKLASDNNTKELYDYFKQVTCSGIDSTEVLKDMESYSQDYSILLEAKTGFSDLDSAIKQLLSIKVTPSYPFFLSLLHEFRMNKFNSSDVTNIIRIFNRYEIRRKILGTSKAENKGFPILVSKIQTLEKSQDKSNTFLQILSNQEYVLRLPNDAELTKGLKEMDFYHFRPSKFILSLLESTITKAPLYLENDENLQIEHIMPQTLNESWEKMLGDDYKNIHDTYVNNIGNLTLIRHNQELGNKSFDEKKKIYDEKAGLQIAKTKILDKEKWDKNAIEDRQKWIISELLNNVLSLPEEYRNKNNYRIEQKEKRGNLFSFEDLGLVGETIDFIKDPTITAKVVNDREVEFEGKQWKLSPLTREIMERKGLANTSGAYQGAQYWEYDGEKLADISEESED